MREAHSWIRSLGLKRHPEGGYYKETYRSDEFIDPSGLPERFSGPRSISTSIYFLLCDGEVSHLHRIKSDELWHFHAGTSLSIHTIDPKGKHQTIKLGPDVEKGEVFQGIVSAGCWFGAEVDDPNSYSLVGCTVAPGFDFEDFELADRDDLIRLHPEHREVIERLTKENEA
jgi:predicted cupin superfamily sugar epimerase